MKVLVTGATGFIGNHVINTLLEKDYEVVTTASDIAKARARKWFGKVKFIPYQLEDANSNQDLFDYFHRPDCLIHLAWQGLPNYKGLFHIERNLFTHYFFLKNLIHNGLRNLTIAGTCLEYGLQSGCLREESPSLPIISYAIAKDSLRKFIEALRFEYKFSLKWIRFFYMYGDGQSPNSIIPLLQDAINNRESKFRMSGGEQLRDYLPISVVADYTVSIATQTSIDGIINCCSGVPISIRKLVESYIKERGSNIKICLGHYPYPDYESIAFWGDNSKLKKITTSS